MKINMDLLRWCKESSGRIKVFQCIAIAIFLYLFCGLFFRQIVQNSHFQQKSRKQSIRRIILPAVRGNIYDRNGNILATNRPIFSLNLYLDELSQNFREKFIKRIKECSKSGEKFDRDQIRTEIRESVVGEILNIVEKATGRHVHISGQRINRHISQYPILPMTVLHNISPEDCDKLIEVLPLSSPLQIGASLTRYYPNNELACHVLGYTVLVENSHYTQKYGDHVRAFATREQVGKSGVEKCADRILAGEVGYEAWIVDHTGAKNSLDERIEPEDGKPVYLSIDMDLQAAAEQALATYTGSVVVIDVNSGEILALANSPSYDQNSLYPSISKDVFDKISENAGWFNQAIQGLFPIGSAFKLVSAVVFIKSEEVDGEEEWLCTGKYSHGGKQFRCNNHPHGECINLKLAIGKSCNTYVFSRTIKVGHEAVSQEAKKFGLGSKTGIELPYETDGMVIPDATWKREHNFGDWLPGDTLNLAIGQGFVRTTPLNVCCFTASLAKNRYKTKPTIFKTEEKIADTTEQCLPTDGHKFLVDAMVDCVNHYTGRKAKIDGIAIAGKTGTAQFKEFGKKRNLAWFTCFAPAYDPKIAVTVLIREKKDGLNYYGGHHAAPVARKILLKYFEKNNKIIPLSDL
jgi:penicillin-binding protein 2